jgi:hypothetical protein
LQLAAAGNNPAAADGFSVRLFEECESRENRQSVCASGKANPNAATPIRFTITCPTPDRRSVGGFFFGGYPPAHALMAACTLFQYLTTRASNCQSSAAPKAGLISSNYIAEQTKSRHGVPRLEHQNGPFQCGAAVCVDMAAETKGAVPFRRGPPLAGCRDQSAE